MSKEGARQLRSAGVDEDRIHVSLAADVRHTGQGDSITVQIGEALGSDPASQVEEAFAEAYVRLYGRRPPGVGAEVLTWRVRVSGPRPRLRVGDGASGGGRARKGSREMWFAEADGFVDGGVYDRYLLAPGAEIRGPAVVEERESTAVIGPGGRARVDAAGNLEVHLP